MEFIIFAMLDNELIKSFNDESDDAENSAVWESHANNIIIGIEANDDVKPVRAIWEMVQNARDERRPGTLANIVFTRKKGTFVFQHDGQPFTKIAIASLIIQTSSKTNNEPEKVGKYGTGFLTTHKFGRVFNLSGALRLKRGLDYFYNFDNFEINRSSEDKVVLGKAIKSLIDKTKTWNQCTDKITKDASPLTTFTYTHRDEQERKNAKDALDEAPDLVPYVIALNRGVGSIELIDEVDGNTKKFVRNGNYEEVETADDYCLKTCVVDKYENGVRQPSETVFLLESSKDFTPDNEPRVTVILPLHSIDVGYEAFDYGKIPHLFLHLPLLGTSDWALNYIIHAPKFSCDKENRDNVRFSGNSEETKAKANANRELTDLAYTLILQFIDRNLSLIKNRKLLTPVKYRLLDVNDNTKEYFKTQQAWWVSEMESREYVENENSTLLPSEIKVFDEELLEACTQNESLLDAIYYLFAKAGATAPVCPKKVDMLYWSRTINDWYDDKENAHFLSVAHIADLVSSIAFEEIDLDQLLVFEQYLADNNKTKVFDKAILPNIDLSLCTSEDMLDAVSFSGNVMDVLRVLSPETIDHIAHPKFAKLLKLSAYTNESLKSTLSQRISELVALQKDSDVKRDKESGNFNAENYNETFFSDDVSAAILKLNMMIVDEDSTSAEARMLPYLREFYSFDEVINERLNKGLFDRRTCCNALLRDALFKFTCMSDEEKNKKSGWIKSLLLALQEYKDIRDKILVHYEVCPDQMGCFSYADKLSMEDGSMHEELKNIYDKIIAKVTDEDKSNSIRHKLINTSFNTMLPPTSITPGQTLASELEKIVRDEYNYNLKDQTYTDDFVRIIKFLSGTDDESLVWQDLFKDINSKKGELLLSAIESEKKKEHIFRYINADEDKLELLSSVMDSPDLADIIRMGQDGVKSKKREDNEFNFKLRLGKYVEQFLRMELAESLNGIDLHVPDPIKDRQGGQDIVIMLDDKVAYYIEVKSRWGTDRSVLMSTTQHVNSIRNKDMYALCAVNMCGYLSEYGEEAIDLHLFPEDPKEITDRMRFLENIGTLNSDIEDACTAKVEKVYVDSGYRVHITQDVIRDNSVSFKEFTDHLISYLKAIL